MSEAESAPLRVRTRRDYPVRFLVDLGQRNAVFLKRRWTPLRRIFYWADAFAVLPERDYDIVHSINAVPILSRRPYVLTYEDYLPRVPEDRYVGWLERRLQRALLSERCVALIAMSEFGRRQFRWQNRSFDGRDELEAKMQLVYPAIGLRRERPKRPSGRMKLLFVGTRFMGKAGPAVLRAHSRLRDAGLPVETTVVSSLEWTPDDYLGPPSHEYVESEVARLSQEGVVHHRSLRNDEVFRLMEEADWFVFPTLQDTFGYASLEALACGTPVLATDTCAQPEIVDASCGYLLPFENDEHVGKWSWLYRADDPEFMDAYEATIASLTDAIVDRLTAAFEAGADAYEAMSAGALQRVRTRFDREAARDRLEQLYELCRERL
ncbi:MAG: glycosyltransferase family 4 protein [Thermoleophilaceae bacterium]